MGREDLDQRQGIRLLFGAQAQLFESCQQQFAQQPFVDPAAALHCPLLRSGDCPQRVDEQPPQQDRPGEDLTAQSPGAAPRPVQYSSDMR